MSEQPVEKIQSPPNDRTLLSERITKALLGKISSGTLRPGDRLPSEGSLATEYGAARGTVRVALNSLRDDGLIMSRPGVGSFVVELSGTEPASARFIAEVLEDEIKSGVYTPGVALPSESAVASRFGVTRHSARAALTTLEAKGFVVAIHGKGRFLS